MPDKFFVKKIIEKSGKYIKEFADTCTLHGVRYFFYTNAHFIEILLWITGFCLSTHRAVLMINNSWQRYNDNPTVIAIQKNYRDWNVTFPAATFCFTDALDENLAKKFIFEQWGIEVPVILADNNHDMNMTSDSIIETADGVKNITKFDYYMEFLRNLVNITYENVHKFDEYKNDETIKNLNIESIIMKVLLTINQTSVFYTKEFKDREFQKTPTELGICYTHGGVLSDYITIRGKPSVRENFRLPTCNILNASCYARTEGLPRDVRYSVHSPYEIPDISDNWFVVRGRTDRDTTFTVLETVVAPELYRLNPSQRQCRFLFESVFPQLPVYSFNLCRMQCRKELSFKLCGCAPYFYTNEGRIPICRVNGLACLAKYSEMLIMLRQSDGKKLPCNCVPQCIDNKYFKDRDTIRQWTYPVPYDVRFRWAIEKFSKIRLRRGVIYSFEDLLVSLGGTAAFFLGCSVLSFVEIVYFFTLRLYWSIKNET